MRAFFLVETEKLTNFISLYLVGLGARNIISTPIR